MDDKIFQAGDEVDLYWIEYDLNGVDEKSRECVTHYDGFETVRFDHHEQIRIKKEDKIKTMDRYVIRMRKKQFDDVVINKEKRRKLVVTDIENEDPTDHEYVLISVWVKDRNWYLQKVVESSSEDEEISESSDLSSESGDESSSEGSSYFSKSSSSDDEDEEYETDEEGPSEKELKKANAVVAKNEKIKKARMNEGK